MSLVNYTSAKLCKRPANITPLIRVHSNGTFLVYKSLLKALKYKDKADRILFSHDEVLNTWYVSLDPRGIELRRNDINYGYLFNTTVLRNRILQSQEKVLKSMYRDDEAFYLSAELVPSRVIEGKELFKIELIAS